MRIHISDLDIESGWSDAIKNRRNLLLEETYESRKMLLKGNDRHIEGKEIAYGHGDLKKSGRLDAGIKLLLPDDQNHEETGNRGGN